MGAITGGGNAKITLLLLALLLFSVSVSVFAEEAVPYLDTSQPIESRVEDLLARLTLEEKIQMWLDAGARSVWLVDPDQQTLIIRRADGSVEVIRGDEALRDEFVLPGFVLAPLSLIFER